MKRIYSGIVHRSCVLLKSYSIFYTMLTSEAIFLSGALKPKSLQLFLGFVKSYVLLSFQMCVR